MLVRTKTLMLITILMISTLALLVQVKTTFASSSLLTGRVFDRGIDTDGNQLFDWLEITIEADINPSGYYYITASGIKTSADQLYPDVYVSDYLNTYFDAGLHNVTLKFYGPTIQASYMSNLSLISGITVSAYSTYESLSNISLSRAYSYLEFDSAFTKYGATFLIQPNGTIDLSGFMNASHLKYPMKGLDMNGDVDVSTVDNTTTIAVNQSYKFPPSISQAWPYNASESTMHASYSQGSGDLNVGMNSSMILQPNSPYPDPYLQSPYSQYAGSSYPWNSSDFTLSLASANGLVNGELTASTTLPTSAFSVLPFNATDFLLKADYAAGKFTGNVTLQILPDFPLSDVLLDFEATRQKINFTGQITVVYGTYPIGQDPLVIDEAYVDQMINNITNMKGTGPGSLFNSTNGLIELDSASEITRTSFTLGATVDFSIILNGDPVALIAYYMMGTSSLKIDSAGYYRVLNATMTSFSSGSITLAYQHDSGTASLDVSFTENANECLTRLFTIPEDMTALVISSNSMYPMLKNSDLILAKNQIEASEILLGPPPYGDILLIRDPNDLGTLVVTRAVNSTVWNGTRYFATQGDWNPSPDYWSGNGTSTYMGMISEEYIAGKVVERIPYLGIAVWLTQQYLLGPHPQASVKDILLLYRDTFTLFKNFNLDLIYRNSTRRFDVQTDFTFDVQEFRSTIVPRFPDLVDPTFKTFAGELLLNYCAEITSAEVSVSYQNGEEKAQGVFVVDGEVVGEINHLKSLILDKILEYGSSVSTSPLLVINSSLLDPSNLKANYSLSEDRIFFGFEGFRVSPPLNAINSTSFRLYDFFNITAPQTYYQPDVPGNDEQFEVTLQGMCNGNQIVTMDPTPLTPPPDYVNEDRTLMVWSNVSVSSLRYVIFVLGYCTEIFSGGQAYPIISYSNGTVSQVTHDASMHSLSLTVDGPMGETGYINMSVPRELVDANASDWVITVDGRIIDSNEYTLCESAGHTFIYLTFTFGSPVTIRVVGTIPEMPFGFILSTLCLASLFAVGIALLTRKRVHMSKVTTSSLY